MKKHLLYSAVLSFVSVIIIIGSGCSKARIEKQLNAYDPVKEYLDTKKQAVQVFEITDDGTAPVTGTQGTELWPYADIFMYTSGDSVKYPITIKLIELYTPKDMIYYQMPTVASGTLLKTAGEIRVRAFKDTTELVLRPNKTLTVQLPASSPTSDKSVYYGFSASSYTDWTADLSSLDVTNTNADKLFTATTTGYKAAIGKMGWINCGKAEASSTNHKITFTSDTDDLTNIGIFIYFPATNSLMQVYNEVSGNIPDGSAVKIIAIGITASGDLYSYSLNEQVYADQTLNITMTATTDAAITALLDAF
jgi:hypothetical protein